MHDMMFIGIQYGSVMFHSSLRFGVDWALVLVCWHFVLFIVFFITFVYKSLSVFFPLYLFGFGLTFVLLEKWENTRVPSRGYGGLLLICRRKKSRRESLKRKKIK